MCAPNAHLEALFGPKLRGPEQTDEREAMDPTLASTPPRAGAGTRVTAGAILIVLIAVFAVLQTIGRGEAAFMVAGTATITAVVGRRAWRTERGSRTPWWLLTIGLGGYAAGELLVVTWPLLAGEVAPFPSPAHIPYQLGLLLVAAALTAFTRSRSGPDLGAALDSFVAGMSIGLVAWILLVQPVLATTSPGWLAHGLVIVNPLGHILLLVALFRFLLVARPEGTSSWALAGGMAALVVTAIVFGIQLVVLGHTRGGPVEVGWVVAFWAFGVAATDRSADELARRRPSDRGDGSLRRIVSVGAATLSLPALLVLRAHDGNDVLIAGVLTLLLLAVTIRTAHLLRTLDASRHQGLRDQRARDHRRFEALVRHATDVLLVLDSRDLVSYASPSAIDLFGVDPVGWTLQQLDGRLRTEDREVAAIQALIASADGRPVHLRARMPGEHEADRHLDIVAVDLLDDPDVNGIVLTLRETTERAALEEELRWLAFHDSLTGLSNRQLFQNRLAQAVNRASRTGRDLAVLLCDLDDFKDVNDTLGHPAGDRLLQELAHRFEGAIRTTDTVSRLGGDEFAVLCEDLDDGHDAVLTARRLLEATRDPIHIDGHELRIGMSVGVAVDDGTRSSDELLRDADVALYDAKAEGKHRWSLHLPDMTARAQARSQLATDLGRAVADDRIEVAFQTIVSLDDGRTVGVEALARWDHPIRGLVSPKEFIAVAEQSGLIVPLGNRILDRSFAALASWRDARPGLVLRLGVNVTTRQMRDGDLVEQIEQLLRRYAIDPSWLILELTESVMIDDLGPAITAMRELREMGVGFAVDDFGTGYSSLSYLRRLPVDVVKIDRSFVQELTTDPTARDLVEAIIQLSRTLRLDSLAEGVETDEQRAILRSMGCGFAQGHLFSSPLPGSVITQRLTAVDANVVLTDIDPLIATGSV